MSKSNKNCWWRDRGKFLDIPLLDESFWSYFCQFWETSCSCYQTNCLFCNKLLQIFFLSFEKQTVAPNANVSLLQAGGSLKGQAFMWFVSLKYFQRYNTWLFDEKTLHLKLTFVGRKEAMACSQSEVGLWQALYLTGSFILCQVLELQHLFFPSPLLLLYVLVN